MGLRLLLIMLVEDLHWGLDKESTTLFVLLDILATFDSITQDILLACLAKSNIGDNVLQWFQSNLSECIQKNCVGRALLEKNTAFGLQHL